MICEKCKTAIPDAAKFCPKCGAKVEAAKPEALAKKCPTCGAGYPINVKFCKKDGAPLQKVPTPKEEIRPPELKEKEVEPEAVIEPKAEEVTVEAKVEEKPPEKPPEPEKPKVGISWGRCF